MRHDRFQRAIWHHFSDPNSLIQYAFNQVQNAANQAISRRQRFRIVLAGGHSPKTLYGALRELRTDWSAWEVYFSDERCLPLGDPERNDQMAHRALLDHVGAGKIFALPAQDGPMEGAAQACKWLGDSTPFDLTLLGMGKDGHTASLFPSEPGHRKTGLPPAIAVTQAPKPPPERVSLSVERLSNSRRVLFLVSGDEKLSALRALRRGDQIPAAKITALNEIKILYHTSESLG